MAEDFPSITLVREQALKKTGKAPGAKYFGPKLASSKVYETMRILKRLFPFRHCRLKIRVRDAQMDSAENLAIAPQKDAVEVGNRIIDFPCLDYFIKRCPGPCIGAISPNEYKKIVQQLLDFLNGKTGDLEEALKTQMTEAASSKLFEKAARIRDKLLALQRISERQKVTDPDRKDTDVIHGTAEGGHLYFSVFMIREGMLVNHENFVLDAPEISDLSSEQGDFAETFHSFLLQYYERSADIPKEILIPDEIEDPETLEAWLTRNKGERVKLLFPKRGDKNKLLELCLKNAVSFAKQYRLKWLAEQACKEAPSRLAAVLGLRNASLRRIEGFDISHLGGNETVGSMVVFENGIPKSEHYRHFAIRTVSGKPDDYRSMEEVLMRRLKYLKTSEKIRIKKATKASESLIAGWGRSAGWRELSEGKPDLENFFILYRENKVIGMVRLLELQKGIFEISGLFIAPEYRGEKLSYIFLEKLIGRVKDTRARFYIAVEKDIIQHYAEFGFIEVKEAPQAVKERRQQRQNIDGKDYVSLAFYKAKKKPSDPSFSSKPDLLVVDGGKGQLGMALAAQKSLRLDIPAISLAKRLEEIYLPQQQAPLLLEEGDEALKLLQRIRDEAHRFAITFQRKQHSKNLLQK
ncbi:GNAT family N-acetyltransferase [Candidatus Peregrinibacteria bacterium]|nr:GNAT family N-acetyltransferase [Candidatus Peregrinibacteria bacterium]